MGQGYLGVVEKGGSVGPPTSPRSLSSPRLWRPPCLVLLPQVSLSRSRPFLSPGGWPLCPCSGVVPQGGGARPHQGGIRAGLSSCLTLKACLDTCRTSPSQACTSCLREAESAASRASTALVTWGKQRVRDSSRPPAPQSPLVLGLQLSQGLPKKSLLRPHLP